MITQKKIDEMKSFVDDGICPVCADRPGVVNIHMEGPYMNNFPVCTTCHQFVFHKYDECPSCGVMINPIFVDPWEGDVYSDTHGAYNCTDCSDKITYREENY